MIVMFWMLIENKSELCNAYCFCFEPQAKQSGFIFAEISGLKESGKWKQILGETNQRQMELVEVVEINKTIKEN